MTHIGNRRRGSRAALSATGDPPEDRSQGAQVSLVWERLPKPRSCRHGNGMERACRNTFRGSQRAFTSCSRG